MSAANAFQMVKTGARTEQPEPRAERNRRLSEAAKRAAATLKRKLQRRFLIAGANSQPAGDAAGLAVGRGRIKHPEPGSQAHRQASVTELLERIRAREGQ